MYRRIANAARGQGGFTLVELLVTVVIIVILSLAVRAAVEGYITKSRIARCQTELAGMRQVIQMYYVNYETYPATAQEVAAAMKAAGVRWDPNDPAGVRDPWGMPYYYNYYGSSSPSKYVIFSLGPDKKGATGDEIYADLFGVNPKGKVGVNDPNARSAK